MSNLAFLEKILTTDIESMKFSDLKSFFKELRTEAKELYSQAKKENSVKNEQEVPKEELLKDKAFSVVDKGLYIIRFCPSGKDFFLEEVKTFEQDVYTNHVALHRAIQMLREQAYKSLVRKM